MVLLEVGRIVRKVAAAESDGAAGSVEYLDPAVPFAELVLEPVFIGGDNLADPQVGEVLAMQGKTGGQK